MFWKQVSTIIPLRLLGLRWQSLLLLPGTLSPTSWVGSEKWQIRSTGTSLTGIKGRGVRLRMSSPWTFTERLTSSVLPLSGIKWKSVQPPADRLGVPTSGNGNKAMFGDYTNFSSSSFYKFDLLKGQIKSVWDIWPNYVCECTPMRCKMVLLKELAFMRKQKNK